MRHKPEYDPKRRCKHNEGEDARPQSSFGAAFQSRVVDGDVDAPQAESNTSLVRGRLEERLVWRRDGFRDILHPSLPSESRDIISSIDSFTVFLTHFSNNIRQIQQSCQDIITQIGDKLIERKYLDLEEEDYCSLREVQLAVAKRLWC